MKRVYAEVRKLCIEIVSTTLTLFKVMIPMIILVEIADHLGGVELLSELLEPLMSILGLPGSMALVWATTMLTNLYAGILVLVNTDVTLTVAQVTILGSLLLVCHGLPIEGMISKRAGVPIWASLVVRVGGGLLFAWLQAIYYEYTEQGKELAQILWSNDAKSYANYYEWTIGQFENLAAIFCVISVLIILLRLLKFLKIEHLMSLLMVPFLKVLRVSRDAANLAVIGITLGLSYGGGLIINESQKGRLTKHDAVITVLLLNLVHSIFEDTALILLLGADLNMILWGRVIFSIIATAIISHVYLVVVIKKRATVS